MKYRQFRPIAGASLLALFVCGCAARGGRGQFGDGDDGGFARPEDSGIAIDGGPTLAPDGGDAMLDAASNEMDGSSFEASTTCALNLTDCGGVCVDQRTDPSHCGACSLACTSLAPYCIGGQCTTFVLAQTWSAVTSSNNGTATASTTGGGTSETLGYSDQSTDVYSGQSFTLRAVATVSTPLAFHWKYEGSHAYWQASASLSAFAAGPNGTTTVTLLATTTTNGSFSFSGSSSITVHAGYAFGFVARGQNNDSMDVLSGTLVVSP